MKRCNNQDCQGPISIRDAFCHLCNQPVIHANTPATQARAKLLEALSLLYEARDLIDLPHPLVDVPKRIRSGLETLEARIDRGEA